MSNGMAHSATLYRMATEDHLCPFGLKARALLKREGYDLDDRRLTSRPETEAFKARHHVQTTPQIFIDGERIGGYDALRRYLDKGEEASGGRYAPIISVFAVALLCALALSWATRGALLHPLTIQWFVALSMATLAVQKLQNITAFANRFITYDLLAMRTPRYAYVYPFAEALVAVGMLASAPAWLVAPVAIFIGGVGAASVVKAVYIDQRELKCACVGGDTDLPLGAISLSENLGMVAMAIWMLL